MNEPKIRVAFGSVPKGGGTYTFFRNLRPVLLKHDIDLRCAVVGKAQAALVEQQFWTDGCALIAPEETDLQRQSQAFAKWCETENIDIAMGVNSIPILAAIHHLPGPMKVISRCANGFEEGYRLSLMGHERLSRQVALVPRLRDDLIEEYSVDPDRIDLIPNGIAPGPFEAAAAAERGTGSRLELGFVGRLEHRQKGVFHLKTMADALVHRNVPFRLSIVGKGKHERHLAARLQAHISAGRVRFLGSCKPTDVIDFLGTIDAYLFTSHFEGCPNSLLEAMMAGAVPISWMLPGITDYLIADGRTGFLLPVGEVDLAADRIASLHADREALSKMSREVSIEARARFSNEVCALRYAKLFRSVMEEPMPDWVPEPWAAFDPGLFMAPPIRTRMLSAVTNRGRNVLERLTARAHGIRLPSDKNALR